MRRRLPSTFALVAFACCAAVGNANGGGGGHASAPAPAPSGGGHGGGGSAHGGGGSSRGSGGSGGSAHGGGSSRGSGGSGGGRSYGGGSARGSGPIYGGGTSRGGAPVYGGGASRAQGGATSIGSQSMAYAQAGKAGKPGDVPRTYEFRWVCTNPGGGVYYSWAGPCPDYLPEEPAAAQHPGGQPAVYANGTDYATDPWAVGVGPGAGTPRMADLPILTRTSDTIAPYAVILRDGMAFASVDRPKQSGKMIVARDRSGNLFSIRATEVDLAATKPATP